MMYLAKSVARGHDCAVPWGFVLPRVVRSLVVGFLASMFLTATAVAALPGDADCNGVLNGDDLRALTVALANPTTCATADVNGDGRVTAADLLAEVALLAAPAASPTPGLTLPPTATDRKSVV